MQPLIVGIAQGSGGTRVLDEIVQTFLPVSKTSGGPVAVVELDQPYAFVEARIGSFWSMVRVAFAFGLVISLLLLGLAFLSSRRLARGAEDDDRLPEGDEVAAMVAAEQLEEPLAEEPAPTFEEDLRVRQPDLDEAADQEVDQDNDLPADIELQELVRRREEFAARAKEAKRRVKKLETQLQEAPSAPKSDQ
jgi:flagellar biosynthesis/type III secretory pathway M-ring protein FliF/YscJ